MKRLLKFIPTAIVLVLLIWVLWDINFFEVYELIANVNPLWFFLAVFSSVMVFVVWNLRCQYIFNPYIKGDFKFFMHVLLAGSFFNTVTPGAGIGGEPFRAHFLAKKYKKPHSKVLAYVLGDSFFKISVLFCLVIFSVFFVLIYVKIPGPLKITLEVILISVFLIFSLILFFLFKQFRIKPGILFKKLYFFEFVSKRFESEKHFVSFINKVIHRISKVFRKVVVNKNNLFVGFILTIFFWLFNFLIAYFLFLSFGHHVNFVFVLVVVTLAEIVGAISIFPGGVGVIEGSMTLLYSAMGIPPPLALLVSFLSRMIYYFFSLFIGGMSLVYLRKNSSKGKRNFF